MASNQINNNNYNKELKNCQNLFSSDILQTFFTIYSLFKCGLWFVNDYKFQDLYIFWIFFFKCHQFLNNSLIIFASIKVLSKLSVKLFYSYLIFNSIFIIFFFVEVFQRTSHFIIQSFFWFNITNKIEWSLPLKTVHQFSSFDIKIIYELFIII